MGIVVTCPSCQYTSKAPQEYAGREVICPQCGNALRVPPLAPFSAPDRGSPSATFPPASGGARSCPSCQRAVSGSATVCIWCGAALDPDAAALTPSPTGTAAAAPPEAFPPNATRTCPYCAETIKATARKCPHCAEILDQQLAATRRHGPRARVVVVRDIEKQARDAFIVSIFAIFCCQIVLGPIAIIQGAHVNKQLDLMGEPRNGLATAAVVLGIVSLVILVVGVFINVAGHARF